MHEREVFGNGRFPLVDLFPSLAALFLNIRRHHHECLVRRLVAIPRRPRRQCGDTAKDDPQCFVRHVSLSLRTSDSEPGADQAKRSPITKWNTVAQQSELRLTERLGGSVAAEQALVERAR